MNDSDKMRKEFEAWASERFLSIERLTAHKTVFDGQYASLDTQEAWTAWQSAYAAGQEAERLAIAAEVDEFFNRHHDWRCKLAGVAMAAQIRNKPEGEL